MRRLILTGLAGLLLIASVQAQSIPPLTQTISVQDSGAACSVAGTCATWNILAAPSVTIQITGTFSATLTFEATSNNLTWFSVNVVNLATGVTATTTTTTGQYALLNPGLVAVRARAGTLASGGANLSVTKGSSSSATRLPVFSIGTGTATASAGGTVFVSTTATSTTGLTEETLLSYTLPANTLAVNGRGVRITAWGSFAANANVKQVLLYFGATVVATFGGSPNGTNWTERATVYRASATTQVAIGEEFIGTGNGSVATTTPGETLSGTVLIKVTGIGVTTIGDITAKGLLVEAI